MTVSGRILPDTKHQTGKAFGAKMHNLRFGCYDIFGRFGQAVSGDAVPR